MDVTVERNDLMNALARLLGVVEKRNTIPVLSNVLLRAAGGFVELVATDLDIEIIDRIPSQLGIDGTVTVSAAMLSDAVRQFRPGSDVRLVIDGPRLGVRSAKSKLNLPILPAADFPVMSEVKDGVTFSLLRSDIRRLIQKTKHAVSTEATRYYLNGVYLHSSTEDGDTTLRAVATTGHVLAAVDMPLPEGAGAMPGVIVPRKTCDTLIKMTADSGPGVEVTVGRDKIRFKTGDIVLTSKVIDGSFPDYGRVIPRGNGNTTVTFQADDMGPALNLVATVSIEKSRAVKFGFGEGAIQLQARNMEAGEATDEVAAEVEGPSFEMGFNALYVRDLLNLAAGQSLTWHLTDASSPVRVHIGDDPNAQYVLMPLRV